MLDGFPQYTAVTELDSLVNLFVNNAKSTLLRFHSFSFDIFFFIFDLIVDVMPIGYTFE